MQTARINKLRFNMNSNVVFSSQRQIVMSLLASIAFVALCIGIMIYLADEKKPLFYLTAFFALPLFSYSTVMSLKHLLSKAPILNVNESGITDHASGLSVGFIPWSDILGAEITLIEKQKYLHIYLKNPEAYVKKASIARRLMMRVNSLFGGSPISIPQLIMPESLEDIFFKINQFKQADEKKLQDRSERFSRKI
jgi:hypothetical protein